jgi:hypothetical protein
VLFGGNLVFEASEPLLFEQFLAAYLGVLNLQLFLFLVLLLFPCFYFLHLLVFFLLGVHSPQCQIVLQVLSSLRIFLFASQQPFLFLFQSLRPFHLDP